MPATTRFLSNRIGKIGSCSEGEFSSRISTRINATHAIPEVVNAQIIAVLRHGKLDPPSCRAKTNKIEATRRRKAPSISTLFKLFRANLLQMRLCKLIGISCLLAGRNIAIRMIDIAPPGALNS